jgi:hypothetical protein
MVELVLLELHSKMKGGDEEEGKNIGDLHFN